VTAALVTRGMIGAGATADGTAPTITNMTPSPSVAPGEPGGFPADFHTARTTPIEFDVTDTTPGLALIILWCKFSNRTDTLVVYDGVNLLWPFDLSTIAPISDGYHFSILPRGGWPPDCTISFHVRSIDQAGNIATDGP
jgi:hypothetical protein